MADKRMLKLIRAFLKAGVMEDGLVSSVDEGTPQGGPLTPRTQSITSNLSAKSSLSVELGITNDTPSDLDLCLSRLYLYVICHVPVLLNGRYASIAPECCFSAVRHSPKRCNGLPAHVPYLHVRRIATSSRLSA